MPSSTAPSKQQADVYKRVVRMLARAFYTRNVPEKDPNAPEPRTDTQRRKAKEARLPGLHAEMEGLAVVIIDALTRREWVQEDYVPQAIDGAPDLRGIGLAQQLHIHPKALRSALRYLEQEQVVWREHRAFKRRRQGAADEEDGDAKADASASVGDAVDEEADHPKGKLTFSFVCIDYARCVDAFQLRLHKVRKYLKEQAADRSPVQTYQCPRCRTVFSSLDAIRLLDPASQLFLCDNCGCAQGLAKLCRRAEVQQQFADGGVGDTAERRRNRERRRAQLAQLDAGLAPLAEMLGRLKGVDPPDYGSFDEWSQKQAQRAAVRARAKAGGRGAGDRRFLEPEVEVQLGAAGEEEDAAVTERRAAVPWLLADGVGDDPYATPGSGPSAAAAKADADAAEAPPADVQAAYVAQYMATVARLAAARGSAGNEKKPAVGDEKKGLPEAGGWATVWQPTADEGKPSLPGADEVKPAAATAAPPDASAVAAAAAAPAPADFDEDVEWEDLNGGDGDTADAAEDDDDVIWEDTG